MDADNTVLRKLDIGSITSSRYNCKTAAQDSVSIWNLFFVRRNGLQIIEKHLDDVSMSRSFPVLLG